MSLSRMALRLWRTACTGEALRLWPLDFRLYWEAICAFYNRNLYKDVDPKPENIGS